MVLLSKALDISPLVLLGIEEYVPNIHLLFRTMIKSVFIMRLLANQFKQSIGEIDNPYPMKKVEFFALSLK